MPAGPPYLSLVLVALLAFAVPLLTARVRTLPLPVVVGEILAGIVVGRSGLNLVRPDPLLEFMSDFGLAYLMFLSGLELDFEQLLPGKRGRGEPGRRASLSGHPLLLPLLAFALSLAASVAAAFYLTRLGLIREPWLAGFIFATTSLGIVLPVLKERRLTGTPYGQGLLAYASLADFVTMLLIAVWAAAQGRSAVRDLLYLFLFLMLFVQIYRSGVSFTRHPLVRRLLEGATGHFDVRASMALVLVFLALAQQLGVETILGAFLAGAIISLLGRDLGEHLRVKLDAIGFGFFVPFFFILFGANLHLWSAFASGRTWYLLPAFMLVAYAVKVVPILVFRFRYTWADTMAGGLLLSAQLSLTIAAAEIGLRLGTLDEATVSAFLLMAILTSMLSPMAFARLSRVHGSRRDLVLVAGDGPFALGLAQRLASQVPTVLLALQPFHGDLPGNGVGFRVVRGTGDMYTDLRAAGARRARALLAVSGDPHLNIVLADVGKGSHEIENTIAMGDPGAFPEAAARGVRLITPETSTLLLLAAAALAPGALDLLSGGEDARLEEVEVLNPVCGGVPLHRCRFPAGVLVVGLARGSDRIVARGNTVLQIGDRATLMGPPAELARARELLESQGGA